ncbi:MAG: VOC family protein [Rhabdochlamydiaceae bacterium]|jgi:predicted enzyme related to lactoylglutathione lyase
MNLKSMNLAWIVVNDLKKAVKFYTETVGLKLNTLDEQFGWAELEGNDGGARIGIAQMKPNSEDGVEPGQNAILTFTVLNLEEAIADLLKKSAKLLGDIQVVPGHVKLQMVADVDGNRFQLVETIVQSCACC